MSKIPCNSYVFTPRQGASLAKYFAKNQCQIVAMNNTQLSALAVIQLIANNCLSCVLYFVNDFAGGLSQLHVCYLVVIVSSASSVVKVISVAVVLQDLVLMSPLLGVALLVVLGLDVVLALLIVNVVPGHHVVGVETGDAPAA